MEKQQITIKNQKNLTMPLTNFMIFHPTYKYPFLNLMKNNK